MMADKYAVTMCVASSYVDLLILYKRKKLIGLKLSEELKKSQAYIKKLKDS